MYMPSQYREGQYYCAITMLDTYRMYVSNLKVGKDQDGDPALVGTLALKLTKEGEVFINTKEKSFRENRADKATPAPKQAINEKPFDDELPKF